MVFAIIYMYSLLYLPHRHVQKNVSNSKYPLPSTIAPAINGTIANPRF